MLEIAGQSPAESMNAALGAAATSLGQGGGDGESRRRYTAEDFRALIARLSNGGSGKAKRPSTVRSPIAAPEFVAWRWPMAEPVEAEKGDGATGPVGVSDAQDAGEDARDSDAADIADIAGEFGPEQAVAAGGNFTTQPQEATSDEPEVSAVADESAEASEVEEMAFHSPVDESESETASAEVALESDVAADEADAGLAPSEPVTAVAETAIDSDLQSAETARTLLDIMAMPTGVQPQERALAGDTLLRLVSRMPVASLISLCERLCIMDSPPPLLVRRLINHENLDISGPLLERCPGISDQDLMTMVNTGDPVVLRLIARRRHLSPALTDALIRHGDASVTVAVVRNPGAALSLEAFSLLAEAAKSRTSLQAPLATRPDTPAPIAFELFWTLPPQLRRYVLSRFLTESANLDRILRIAQTLDESNTQGSASPRIADKADCEALTGLIAEGKATEAAQKLATLAGISVANAERIISDSEGEPLTVAMKAIGMSRTQSAAAAEILRDAPAAPLRSNRRVAELQNLFDSLSFTKARVLLTYWDWAVEQSGPYSGKAV